MAFLSTWALPREEAEAERMFNMAKYHTKTYCVIGEDLYHKRPNSVSLHCVPTEEGRQLLEDMHDGECGHHSSSRVLAGKVFRSGFYWPTIFQDAEELVEACGACQHHARQSEFLPGAGPQTLPATWPFAVWGLDLLGPFKRSRGGYR